MHVAEKHHWHILGAGAIGTLMAFKLSQQQLTFSFIGRNNDCDYRYFTDLSGVQHRLSSTARKPIDFLIICTKSTQALNAFITIQSRLNPQSIVICLFNGLGAQQMIQQSTNCAVFFATTTEGVTKTAPASYSYKGAGETIIDHAVLQRIEAKNLPKLFTSIANIEERLIDKLIINSLINPLTVIFDCKNGQLLSNIHATVTMQLLADEIALWLSTYRQYTPVSEVLKLAVKVMHATANNTSSMRQDIQCKQISEIDYINGYWVNHNSKHLNLEENIRIIKKIKDIESTFP